MTNQQQQRQQEEEDQHAMDIYPQLNPMILPEILHRCARFMTRASLLQSILVCRQWHFNLLPQLWTSVQMSFHDKPVKYPLSTVFESKASMVLDLSVSSRFFLEFPDGSLIVCPRLLSLTIKHDTTRNEKFVDDSKVKLIKDHQSTLKVLYINRVSSLDIVDAISGCSLLEELTIGRLELDNERQWLELQEQLSSRLKVLSVGKTIISGSGFIHDPLVRSKVSNGIYSNIQRLDLGTFPARGHILAQTASMMRSPQLTSLRAKSMDIGWMEWLADEISSGRFTALLDRLALPGRNFEYRDLRTVLIGLPGLFSLDLSGTNFSLDTLTMLRNDLPETMSSLQELDLRDCSLVTGQVVQELLSSLSGLEIFAADYVSDLDMLDGGWSWACFGLKKLTLGVVFYREMTLDLVLNQIGQLEGLQELEVSLQDKRKPSTDRVHDLALTLEHGLDRFRNLCRLKRFKASTRKDFPWKAAEASWVLRNWVALEELQLKGLDTEARQFLLARGVAVHHVDEG